MSDVVDLGFCSVEYRSGFMIAIIHRGHSVGYAETQLVAKHKSARLGDTPIGLVLYSPTHADIEPELLVKADRIMEEQGYSFLVVANPSPKHLMVLELMRDYCSVKVEGTLEEAILHAEDLVRTAVCE